MPGCMTHAQHIEKSRAIELAHVEIQFIDIVTECPTIDCISFVGMPLPLGIMARERKAENQSKGIEANCQPVRALLPQLVIPVIFEPLPKRFPWTIFQNDRPRVNIAGLIFNQAAEETPHCRQGVTKVTS